MENQKEMKNKHEIIYVERVGGTKKVMKRICKFDTAEEAQQCINLLNAISNGQQKNKQKKSSEKQWTDTEIMRFQKVFQKDDDALAFMLLLNADIRAGELCALKWHDINLNQGTVNITKTVDKFTFSNSKPKVKYLRNPRVIRLPDDLISRLSIHKNQQSTASDNDYVFNDGRILNEKELNLRLKEILEKGNIDQKITLHDLRKMSNIKRQVER